MIISWSLPAPHPRMLWACRGCFCLCPAVFSPQHGAQDLAGTKEIPVGGQAGSIPPIFLDSHVVPGSVRVAEVAGAQTVVIPTPVVDLVEPSWSKLAILAGAQEKGEDGDEGVTITDMYLVIYVLKVSSPRAGRDKGQSRACGGRGARLGRGRRSLRNLASWKRGGRGLQEGGSMAGSVQKIGRAHV